MNTKIWTPILRETQFWGSHLLLSANLLFNDLTTSKRNPSKSSGFKDTEIADTQFVK